MHRARPLSPRYAPVVFLSSPYLLNTPRRIPIRLAYLPKSYRQFSSSNNQRIEWKTWNPWLWNRDENRPFTKEEKESMKDHHPLLGFPVPFLPRHKLFRRPFPNKKEKAEQLVGWALFDLLLLIAVGYEVYKNYYADPPVFKAPKFTPFSIVRKEVVSPTSFIITLRPEPYARRPQLAKKDPYEKEWLKGTWSVEFKQPQLQIARSYTPLPPRKNDPPGDLRFLIREEAKGEMSRYIARLSNGDKIELRGPHTEVELPKDVTKVLFLAGGTGIAPALQVAHTLLEAREPSEEMPNIRILWANRRREDCVDRKPDVPNKTGDGIIVQELQNLHSKYPNNLQVDYLIDEEGTFLSQKMISQYTRQQSDLPDPAVPTQVGSRLLFVSGPEGFVNMLAGPKKYLDGKQLQGELGGLIGKIGIKGWEVWKQ